MQTFFFNLFGELFSTVFKIFYYDYRLIIFSMVFLCSVIQCMIGVTDSDHVAARYCDTLFKQNEKCRDYKSSL